KIYLPQVREEAEQNKASAIQLEGYSGSETILLVEDEDLVRNYTVTILEKYGYRVLAAPSGGAALKLCEKEGHSLNMVVTDLVMPGMSGSQLIEQLSALYPQIKVLYSSGYTENSIVHHGVLDAGIEFIQKPYGAEELLAKIKEIFEREKTAAPEN
nr:response regulator [Spirochaeta sp.]